MGLYIKEEDVEIRLVGKVRFSDDDEDPKRMPRKLLKRLVNEAEGSVEHDLSPRYSAPFVGTGGTFKALPERPTKEYIRTLCELKAVIRVLETDFGSGTVVDAEKYSKNISARYDSMVDKLLKVRVEGTFQWVYPPLPGLILNYMNEEQDDGFFGRVLVTTEGDGGYPATRINDPSETFFNYDRQGDNT
jgi:hypothetical protein